MSGNERKDRYQWVLVAFATIYLPITIFLFPFPHSLTTFILLKKKAATSSGLGPLGYTEWPQSSLSMVKGSWAKKTSNLASHSQTQFTLVGGRQETNNEHFHSEGWKNGMHLKIFPQHTFEVSQPKGEGISLIRPWFCSLRITLRSIFLWPLEPPSIKLFLVYLTPLLQLKWVLNSAPWGEGGVSVSISPENRWQTQMRII